MADLAKQGQSRAITIDAVAEQKQLALLRAKLAEQLVVQSKFDANTKESTVLAKDIQIESMRAEVAQKTKMLDDFSKGRLVQRGKNISGLLAQENERYAEELTMLQEARSEQEEEQRQSLGRMLLQHLESWAAINGVTGKELLKMQLAVSEKYGLITDTAANKAQQIADNWVVELARMRGESVSFFDLFMERFEALPDEKVIELRFEMATPQVADEGRMGGETFQGGGFSRGGLALVGEGGPELVTLPPGAFVHNAGATQGMMGGAVTNNSFTMNVTTGAGPETVQMGFREMEALAQ